VKWVGLDGLKRGSDPTQLGFGLGFDILIWAQNLDGLSRVPDWVAKSHKENPVSSVGSGFSIVRYICYVEDAILLPPSSVALRLRVAD
jgi:hypothetical protein